MLKELHAYLDLITFYGKSEPNLDTKAHALCFLIHFKDNLPLKLVCDASPAGVATILFNKMQNGKACFIAYSLRILTKVDKI